MAFWSDPSSLFPKQSHRWVVSLDGHVPDELKGDTIPQYFAKSVDRPSYDIGSVQAKYLYSHTFNFPKRLVWKPIKIEFYDVLIEEPGADNQFKNFIVDPKVGINGLGVTPKEEVPTRYESESYSRTTVRSSGTRNIESSVEANITGGGALVRGYETPRMSDFETNTTKFYEQITEEKQYQKSTQLFFYQFLQKCGYFGPNELEKEDMLLRFRSYHFKKNMVKAFNGQKVKLLDENNKNNGREYITLKELDGDGNVLEFWKVYNPLITDVNTGKLDYSSDGIISVTVGISYDWAELVPTKFSSVTNRKPATRYKPPESDE